MIIYVDVLFVINFFITFLLLLFTGKMIKREVKIYRLLIGAALGGLYSLVILFDELNFLVSFFGKIAAALVIVFAAFGFKRLYLYIKAAAIFFFSNMLFLGIMLALWFAFKPQGITVKNNVVYFDISAKLLLISAALAYIISVAVVKIYNHTVAKKEIYSLTVFKNNRQIHMFAFLDSGNKLREPFSDYPVIIADKSKLDFDEERIIPYNTVGGEGVLKAFKPDKIILSSGKKKYETERVYIALSTVDSKDFSAILNPEILNI
ncbi:MAG: sigma-E processing peptidase SpoIIGA [Eubacterium sp.]